MTAGEDGPQLGEPQHIRHALPCSAAQFHLFSQTAYPFAQPQPSTRACQLPCHALAAASLALPSVWPCPPQDFEEALKEVGPSVNPESSTIQQLNEWNAQFGTTGSKGVQAKQLSYYS